MFEIFFIASSLHKRRCPQPGRYSILNSLPSQALSSMRRRNKRRAKSAESTTSKIRQDDEYEQCRSTDVHIGCNSMDQNEVIMAQSCKSGEIGICWLNSIISKLKLNNLKKIKSKIWKNKKKKKKNKRVVYIKVKPITF